MGTINYWTKFGSPEKLKKWSQENRLAFGGNFGQNYGMERILPN